MRELTEERLSSCRLAPPAGSPLQSADAVAAFPPAPAGRTGAELSDDAAAGCLPRLPRVQRRRRPHRPRAAEATPRRAARERVRRERRALMRVREERLRDLGGLALEMYRRDRFRGGPARRALHRPDRAGGPHPRARRAPLALEPAAPATPVARCECGALPSQHELLRHLRPAGPPGAERTRPGERRAARRTPPGTRPGSAPAAGSRSTPSRSTASSAAAAPVGEPAVREADRAGRGGPLGRVPRDWVWPAARARRRRGGRGDRDHGLPRREPPGPVRGGHRRPRRARHEPLPTPPEPGATSGATGTAPAAGGPG